jgi:hypothetical protein
MPVYNTYVYRKIGNGWKLEWKAGDIMADNEDAGKKRSLHALTCRPGEMANQELLHLKSHLYGHGECPAGLALEIVKVANGPDS